MEHIYSIYIMRGIYNSIKSCSVEENLQQKLKLAVYACICMNCMVRLNLVRISKGSEDKKNYDIFLCMIICFQIFVECGREF